MPSRRIEAQLQTLADLRAAGQTVEALATLKTSLADTKNVVVAKAASVVADLHVPGLIPNLLSAYDRLFQNVRETDPQCWGKNAISQALVRLGYSECAPFIRGVQHVQLEPVWGGQEDTASTLRSTCLLGLVQCSDLPRADQMRFAVTALTDSISTVRADAARLLEQLGGEGAMLLLRLKARCGDAEAQVTGQVLEALLKLEGARGVPFVSEFLNSSDDALFEEAALALGASSVPNSLEALLDCWTNGRRMHDANAILRAIALCRREDALEFLLALIKDGRERDAMGAIKALAIHSQSEELRARVAEAAHLRAERTIHDFFYEQFGPPHG